MHTKEIDKLISARGIPRRLINNIKTLNTMRATKKQITESVKYHGFEFSTLIATLKEFGYSVNIKEIGRKTVVRWSTHAHCASASFTKGSESEEKIACEKLRDTYYNLINLRIRHNN